MIGISFYLNDPLAEQRIIEASQKGIRKAFTSLHIPEERGNLASKASKLLKAAKACGMKVYADVSMKTPRHLNVESLEQLSSLGVVGIRLDDFFESNRMIELSKCFHIAVNASTILEAELESLIANGLNAKRLIAWHNFYPRRETGLDKDFFRTQTILFKRYNIPVCAFIPGVGEKRGPVFDGLPTLESHREIHPFAAAVELYKLGITDVYIGDPDHGKELLEKLIKYDKDKILPIRIYSAVLEEGINRIRPDLSRDVLRIMDSRTNESVAQVNTVERQRGMITMDNSLYGRYCGEVQVVLRNLPADERVNVIGTVNSEDLQLLSYIQPGQMLEWKMEARYNNR